MSHSKVTRSVSKAPNGSRRRPAALRFPSRDFLTRSLAGIYRSTVDGRIVECNPAFARIFGYATTEEVRAVNASDLYVEPAERVEFLRQLIQSGFLTNIASRGRRKDGGTVWLLENVTLLKDSHGDPLFLEGMLIDVSDQRRAEEALRESEQRLNLILKSLPVALYVAEVPSDTDATWMSEGSDRLTGFPVRRFLEEPRFWSARIHPEDREGSKSEYRRQLEGGKAEIEYRWRVADGSYRWFTDHAVVTDRTPEGRTTVAGVIIDITDQKEASEAIQRSERYYQGLFWGAHDPIFVFSPEDERILDVNERACETYGFSRDELLAMSLLSISKRPELSARHIQATLERGTTYNFETTQYRKDGSEMTLEVSASRVEYRGRPAILSINRDVTEKRRLQAQLLHSQKMEAIGRLAGGVAHDFNNLLQTMLADAAALRASADPSSAAVIERIESRIQRGASLARQLLLFARKDEPNLGWIDLNTVIDENVRLIKPLIRENVQIAADHAEEPLVLLGDRTQIGQVLVNLMINACDALPKGGQIFVRGGNAGEDTVFLEVEDDGTGIPSEYRDRVFDPFFTTKPAGKGTGLGLAVVHGIVTQHRGQIQLKSEPGHGTLVRILLPRAPFATVPAPAAVAESEVSRGRGERILLVEDETDLLAAVGDFLVQSGFKVLSASTAEDAERIAGEEMFDALISDLSLSGKSGAQLALDLRRKRPALPILIVTGYADEESQHAIGDLPNTRLLRKPVSMPHLTLELRRLLDHATGAGLANT